MARSCVALFIVSFFLSFLSFWTGIAGCWKRSYSNIIATGLLQVSLSPAVDAVLTAGQNYNYLTSLIADRNPPCNVG